MLSDTTLIMLERTPYLPIILLLHYRFQNHRSDAKHNAKVRTVNINVYIRCFSIIFVQVFRSHCCLCCSSPCFRGLLCTHVELC